MSFEFNDECGQKDEKLRLDFGSDALYDALATEIIARKRRDSNVAFLAEIDNDFDKLSSPSEIMDAVGEKIALYFGISSRLTFSEFDKEKNKITVIYDHPSSGMENALGSVCLLEYFSEDLLRDMENGHIIAINDMSADPRTAAQSETYIPWGIRSELLAPYVVEGRLVFVIAVQHNKPYCWCKDEIEFFQDLSGRIYRRLDRARIEEALRQSRVELERQERFFDAMLSNTVDFVYAFNQKKEFVYANQPLKKVWGVKREEYLGKTLKEMDYESGLRELLVFQIERVFETKEVISDEVPYASPSGRYGYWTHILSPVIGSDGNVEFVVGVSRDTTERKQTEEALRKAKSELEDRVQERTRELVEINRQLVAQGEVLKKSEARACQQMAELESIYQSAPVGLCVIDADLRYIRINERFAEMTGISVADHIGRNVREIAPDFADHTESFLKRVIEIGQPIQDVEFSGTTSSQPGVMRTWIQQCLPLRDPDGRISGINVVVEEITARKRAEEALKESEQLAKNRLAELEAIMEATPALIWIARDPECREINGNRLTYEFLKRQPGENISPVASETPLNLTLFSEGVAILIEEQPIQQAAKGKEIRDYEVETRFNDGTSRYIFGNATPLQNENGIPYGAVGAFIDITERKRMEEELRESEERLRVAKSAAQLGIYDYDISSGTMHLDERMRELWGIGPNELITFEEIFEGLHPNDRKVSQDLWNKTLVPAGSGEYYDEYRVINRTDGTELWIAVTGHVFFEHDQPVRMVGTVQDITGRRQSQERLRESEERLRLATGAAEMFGWEVDLKKGNFNWSENANNMVGFPMPRTLGECLDTVHFADRDKVREGWMQAVKKGGGFEFEYRFSRSHSAKAVWAYTAGVVLVNSEGVPVRVVGVTQNITERKKAQEELKNAYEEIKKLNAQLEAENIYLREKVEITDEVGDIIGVSNAIRYVTDRIKQVAQTDATVLLTGETGTGKGLFARALYKFSTRKANPFVHVNCAGLPPNLIESELFGREKGAFTGSTNRQIGRFELAQGGTIFLDEIGELPLELQAKLLKVIEEGELERLGSPYPIKVDVRIIASTNRNLEEEIKKGRFRIDLFYRLNVFPVTIPPLRQRREDILLLVNFFIERFGKKHGKNIKKISHDTIKALENYDWPGNVRELMHVIERAIIVCDGSVLQLAEQINFFPKKNVSEKIIQNINPPEKKSLFEMERELILKALNGTGWRIEGHEGAAEFLGMNPSTLRGRMKKMGIRRPSFLH